MSRKHKPRLGQNFLSDLTARQRIADSLGDLSAATVLEIGPGHGAITDLLATRARRLIAVELDRALAAELRFRFRNHPNVEVLEGGHPHRRSPNSPRSRSRPTFIAIRSTSARFSRSSFRP